MAHGSGPPVDHGWAWFVLIATFGVHITTSAMAKCFGILLVDFQEEFSCSAWALTSIQGTAMALWLGLAPVSNALAARFSSRKVVFAGGLVGSLGFVGSSLSRTLLCFFVFQGIVVGIGYGLAYGPSLVILVRYFKKRRGMAVGVAQSGVGFGSIIVPLMVRYFVNEYGLRGSVLIQGAIMANVCVCAMLMRPWVYPETCEINIDAGNSVLEEPLVLSTRSDIINENKVGSNVETVANDREYRPVVDIESTISDDQMIDGKKHCECSCKAKPRNDRKSRWSCLKYFTWSLFCNPLFAVYFIGIVCCALTFEVSYTMITSLAIDRNFSRDDASRLPSMLGIADFVTRLAIGPLHDSKFVPSRYIFSASVILLGLNAILVPLTFSYVTLAVSSVCYGIFGAVNFVVSTVVLVDVVGHDKYGSAFGLCCLFISIFVIVVAQVIGALHDFTGSWYSSFWLMGALSFVGGLSTCLETLIKGSGQNPPTRCCT